MSTTIKWRKQKKTTTNPKEGGGREIKRSWKRRKYIEITKSDSKTNANIIVGNKYKQTEPSAVSARLDFFLKNPGYVMFTKSISKI